jgi:peptide/nickel transport system substrate-binding protein/oligopeptide transport system substrate-binding protein
MPEAWRLPNLGLLELAAAALLLAGCGTSVAPVVAVAVIDAEAGPFASGVRLSASGQLVRSATAAGLVGLDEQGRAVPGLADRWIVTDDGLSYIFRLRDGTWPDGTELSAESVREGLRQALVALRGTPLGSEFADIDEIRAMTGQVIEIRLARPAPDLLQMLAQPELGVLHGGRGGGPMNLRREGAAALLAPFAPEQLGLPQSPDDRQRARSIRLNAVSGSVAVRLFAAGKADVVLNGRFADYPLAIGAGGVGQRLLRLDPAPGLFGLVVTHGGGFLALPENREALGLAIDRDALASALAVSGWTATTRIVAPGSAGDLGTIAERWSGLSHPQRQSEAAARVDRWTAQHREPASLRLALPGGPGADALFERLHADFDAIGVALGRVAESQDAELRLIDLVARYPRAEWYLAQLSCMAARGLCSASADARLADARAAADPAQRGAMLAEAEAELTAANVYIPLGAPIRWTLVRDGLTGFAVNPQAFHPLWPLAQQQK